MSREGSKPPQTKPEDWERRRAREACQKAEEALELAGFEYEARQVRKIRLYVLSPDA
jgi:hypothetical protein